MTTTERVRLEIETLHEFFVGWFGGTLAEARFEPDFLARFDAKFELIPPAGSTLSLDAFATSVRAARATNPPFRIAIRKVRILREEAGLILAGYEEWQRHALASKPPENGRVATVLFAAGESLRWLHVHETWLPPEVQAHGPYDF